MRDFFAGALQQIKGCSLVWTAYQEVVTNSSSGQSTLLFKMLDKNWITMLFCPFCNESNFNLSEKNLWVDEKKPKTLKTFFEPVWDVGFQIKKKLIQTVNFWDIPLLAYSFGAIK